MVGRRPAQFPRPSGNAPKEGPAVGFVAQRPEKHARMVLVPGEQGVDPVPHGFPPFLAIARQRLSFVRGPAHHHPGPVALLVCLVDHVQSISVAQSVHKALVGVMAGAHGVDVVFLHGAHVPLHVRVAQRAALVAVELVAGDPPGDKARPGHAPDPPPDFEPAKAQKGARLLNDGAVRVREPHVERVLMRGLRAPQKRVLHAEAPVFARPDQVPRGVPQPEARDAGALAGDVQAHLN